MSRKQRRYTHSNLMQYQCNPSVTELNNSDVYVWWLLLHKVDAGWCMSMHSCSKNVGLSRGASEGLWNHPQQWPYPLWTSTDSFDTNTWWELIIKSTNRSHHNNDQKYSTSLSVLEETPQTHQVISADDSSANELFDQVSAGWWELKQWHIRCFVCVLFCQSYLQCHAGFTFFWLSTFLVGPRHAPSCLTCFRLDSLPHHWFILSSSLPFLLIDTEHPGLLAGSAMLFYSVMRA